jgi:hypothetical protein
VTWKFTKPFRGYHTSNVSENANPVIIPCR